ncbi:MAG TPA: ATP-binding protein [Gemmatimonadales bacterium]|nr:ATP-binding protein [Gemmatimonadales bacterium]
MTQRHFSQFGTTSSPLAGGGELGALLRQFDWSSSPLGPVERWPRALKTAVRIVLTSRQPMFVWWGDQLINIYNDAYRSILGGKHPWALGKPASVVWREIWDQVGPRAAAALSQDEGTYDEALLLIMERNGYPEETYYTFSYSPVPDDEGGRGGIFCANTDDTRRIIGERQLALLRELAAAPADARAIGDVGRLSARALASNGRDLPFALIYLLEPDHETLTCIGASGIDIGHQAAPARQRLDADGSWPFREVLRRSAAIEVPDLAAFGPLPTGAWDRPPTRAVALPIAPSGETGRSGVLVAALNPYRLLDDGYYGFLTLVAGQIAAAIANAQAYEEERRRAEALAELDRAKTTFFSNVSHEFRTPLTLLLGPLEEVLRDPAGSLNSSYRAELETAHRNSLRLLKLVNTLLDFSRIEAGRVDAMYEPTDLAAFTTELASAFRSAIERGGLSLVIDAPASPEPVYVDRDMWEKIVLNLLSNALKFTLQGSITIRLRWSDGHVALDVADTGIGIPADELPHIFARFRRVKGARGRTQEGTGIGLALVQELVRLHGGQVQVQSVVGDGTTFTVRIPTGQAHLPATKIGTARTLDSASLGAAPYVNEAARWSDGGAGAAALNDESAIGVTELLATAGALGAPGGAARGRDGRTPRILLADDNADMRDYVARLLGARWRVTAVADGQAALEAALADPPDLVLSDVMMPRLDGFGLLRALRDDPRTRTLPVVLLSARAGEEATGEGLAAGADDYLTKPFTARELLARVGAHLALAETRRAALDREAAARVVAEAAAAQLQQVLEATQTVAFDWHLPTGTAEYSTTAPVLLGIASGATAVRIDIVHPDDRQRFNEVIARAAAAQETVEHEFRIVRPDTGAVRWLHVTGAIRRDDAGQAVRIIGIARDITEGRLAEERAQAAQRLEAVGQLAGGVAHEVNNALTGVLGIANLALRRVPPGDPLQADLEQILKSGQRAATVAQQLLAYSRRQLLQPRRLDLNEVVRAFQPILKQTVGPAHQVLLNLPAAPTWVHADPGQLEQVLLNLALNARDAMDYDGRLTVTVGTEQVAAGAVRRTARAAEVPPGTFAVLTVSDTGAGMDQAVQARLFEPFFTTKPVGQGTGLGLATVYGIVRQSGGFIAVESQLGRGTTFRVFLALAGEVAREIPTPPPPAPRGRREHILVVDDEPTVVLYLERLLGGAGYVVSSAASAPSAWDTIRQLDGRIDLLISDIVMPGMSGRELGERLMLEHPDVPVLYTSGYTDDEAMQRGLLSAGAPFMAKPLHPDKVLSQVRALLDRSLDAVERSDTSVRGMV